ncbi:RING-H2 finger protein atl47 [Phtheirospermum japonicum]|uniref:RING-H2 finger protein atl47 n=1 Tax=Phtheirospermum japonicum TaxID=374723 RepID=A0A830CB77_9LAMI|nr:RING-H2 finger protein atl47 [Phtheirospermum japonicum]
MENRSLSGVDESFSQERVFSVRLGKFKNSNEGLEIGDKTKFEVSSTSSSNSIDARRCYSMGAFQYVVDDADLQVALSSSDGGGTKDEARCTIEQCNDNTELEGKKIINPRSRGDSFSISKIWLWSKRGKFSSFDANERVGVLPTPDRSDLV